MAFFLKKTSSDGAVSVDFDSPITLTTSGGSGYTGNFRVNFEIDLTSTNSVIFTSEGGSSGSNLIFFTSTTNVEVRRSGTSNVSFTLGSSASGRQVYEFEGNATANTIELFQDGVSCGTAAGAFLFDIQKMYTFSNSSRNHDTYAFKVFNSGVLKNDYVNTTGTGSNYPDIEGGNDGTLSGFPTDDSQWEFYGAADTTSTISFDIAAPTFAATAEPVAIPANDADISFNIAEPTFNVHAGTDQDIYYYGRGTQLKLIIKSRELRI